MGAKDSPDAIYDARKLGAPKMAIFGLQHMFAMFGATILVPIAYRVCSVSATLLFAGLGTLLFHLLSKGKVPAFLGSSFAFIAGYAAIAPNGEADLSAVRLPGRGVLPGFCTWCCPRCSRCSGRSASCASSRRWSLGPIVICIGLILASSAIGNASRRTGLIAIVAIAIIVVCNIWGRGMIQIIPILLGVVAAPIVVAALGGRWSTSPPWSKRPWIGLPVLWDNTVFSLFGANFDAGLGHHGHHHHHAAWRFATMIEHIGDMSAISSTCNRNYIAEPGLHRTLLGDGLATILASLFGAPANTTYGENTGVLALTRVFDPRVIRIAACFAIVLLVLPEVRGRHRLPCRPASSAACRWCCTA